MMSHRWIPPLFLALTAAALYFSFLGSYPLTDRDEGEYAATALNMLRSGDVVIPRLNGRDYLEKPILVFWLVSGSMRIFGESEWAVRLPSAAAGVVLSMAFYFLVLSASRCRRTAFLASALILPAPLFALVARTCLTDMPLALCVVFSLLFFFIAVESERGVGRLWCFVLAWVAVSVGFLLKGPVSPAVVGPPVFLYVLWRGVFWETLRDCRLFSGILIFVLVNIPWHWMAYERLGSDFIQSYFGNQIVRRGTSTMLGHGGGPFYYIPAVLIGAFPFSGLGLAGAAACLWRWKGRGVGWGRGRLLAFFSALVFVCVYCVFSAASTKLPHYILPCLPFLSILAVWLLTERVDGVLGRLAWRVGYAFTIGLVLLVAAVGFAAPSFLPVFWPRILLTIVPDSSEYALPLEPLQLAPWVYILSVVAVFGVAVFVWRMSRRDVFGAVMSMFIASVLIVCVGIVVGLSAVRALQLPAVSMARDVGAGVPSGAKLVVYGLWKPSLFYYSGRDMRRMRASEPDDFADLTDSTDYLTGVVPVFVLTRVSLLERLSVCREFRVFERYEGYAVGGNDAAGRIWCAAAERRRDWRVRFHGVGGF